VNVSGRYNESAGGQTDRRITPFKENTHTHIGNGEIKEECVMEKEIEKDSYCIGIIIMSIAIRTTTEIL